MEAPQTERSTGDSLAVLTLTREEAAQKLNISISMLDILTKRGSIPVCRVGRRRLYRPQALAEYLATKETRAA